MNYINKFLSRHLWLVLLISTALLSSTEWKQEVQNCGESVCFNLKDDEKSLFLGSLIWAKETVNDGKEMYYPRYFYEAVSLQNENGEEMHIYGPDLGPSAQEWADSFSTIDFSDYILQKKEEDPTFANFLETKEVRYFNDEEREQTEVHWIDGTLWQIGLDNDQKELHQVPNGVYAFVIGENHLYITPKIKTKKGRIQHSSFLRGGPVRSAGKLRVGENGQIIWLSNDSGHYRPDNPEVIEALTFIQNQMPQSSFEQMWVRFKPLELWDAEEDDRDYEALELDPDHDIPIMEWLGSVSIP